MARGKQIVATLDEAVGFEEDRTGYLGFPPYHQPQVEAPNVVEVKLERLEHLEKFVELDGCDTLLEAGKRSVKSIWYPALGRGERGSNAAYIWVEE